jgi:predicted transcriptional regulator
MKLDSYLSENGFTCGQFARLIGVTPQAVDRYVKGQRIPNEEVMPKIYEMTNGEVTPNDFFDLDN